MINGNTTARFTLNFSFGGSATLSIAAGAITASTCNGNAAFTGNYTVQGCPPANYVIAGGVDPIVPGTADTGNHGDDVDTVVALPFPFVLYGNTYNSVNVSSNGRLDFVVANESGGYVTACLPPPPNIGPYDFTIFPLWEDMRTDAALSGCSGFPGGTCGVFTSVSGVAPNRVFNIEWRAVLFNNNASRQNFEARLYENSVATNKRFDVVFGSIDTTGFNHPYVSGVEGASGFLTQDFCNVLPTQNISRTYTNSPCAPVPSSAVSRKVHGAAGTFDIHLPLVDIGGAVGIEDRTGSAGEHQMVVTFSSSVTLTGASVTAGTGSVGSFSGSGTAVITVNLTGVTNAQRLGVTLANVNNGTATGDVFIPMGVLAGDTNGNGSCEASDVSQTKAQSGSAVTGSNFRTDVNSNGSINASDVSNVKSRSGTSLP